MALWFDNHCHLGDDADEVVARARASGVIGMVTVGCDLADSRAAVATASRHDGVWATAGVHPHEASGGVDGLVGLLAEPVVVAVGEAGLDFHYDHSPRDVQRDVFAAQVALANTYDLPLVIHTREAWDETFALLDAEGVPARTVFHCFTGGPGEAAAGLARRVCEGQLGLEQDAQDLARPPLLSLVLGLLALSRVAQLLLAPVVFAAPLGREGHQMLGLRSMDDCRLHRFGSVSTDLDQVVREGAVVGRRLAGVVGSRHQTRALVQIDHRVEVARDRLRSEARELQRLEEAQEVVSQVLALVEGARVEYRVVEAQFGQGLPEFERI